MEIIPSFNITSIFLFLLPILLVVYNTKKQKRLPPGPWKLPLIGNLHQLVGRQLLPHVSLKELADKYGPLMHLKLGERSTIVISSYQILKDVMKISDTAFANRPEILVSETMLYDRHDMIFAPYGDYWKQMRKICTLQLLSPKKVQSFYPLIEAEIFSCLATFVTNKTTNTPINLSECLNSLSCAIICKASVGMTCKDPDSLILAIKQMVALAGLFNISDMFPSVKFLPFITGSKQKLLKIYKECDRLIEDIVREHEVSISNINRHIDQEDLLHALLRLRDKEGDSIQIPITRDNIKAIVLEVKLGGPVQYRHMYPVEREFGYFKSFVRNKARSEASIAEGYLAEESLTFCSRYMDDIETRFNRRRRICDVPNDVEPSEMSSIFPQLGKSVGASENLPLSPMQKLQAHRYMLMNCAIVTPFVDEFREYVKRSSRGRRPSPTEIERRVNKDFVDWFYKRIMNPDTIDTMSTDLKFLVRGPSVNAKKFTAYNINGFRFRTLAREEGLKTQNSGVFLTSNTSCVASSADGNLRQADLPYYGKLEDIIEINYHGRFRVVLFKCKWADTTRDRGYKKDHWNFNCVNFDKLIHSGEREEHEPYIKASQAQMVYYVDDVVNEGWSVVVHVKPRDLYEMGEESAKDELYENEPYEEQDLAQIFGRGDEYIQLATDHIINETNVVTNSATNEYMSE